MTITATKNLVMSNDTFRAREIECIYLLLFNYSKIISKHCPL
jgi:hypothetical protein